MVENIDDPERTPVLAIRLEWIRSIPDTTADLWNDPETTPICHSNILFTCMGERRLLSINVL